MPRWLSKEVLLGKEDKKLEFIGRANEILREAGFDMMDHSATIDAFWSYRKQIYKREIPAMPVDVARYHIASHVIGDLELVLPEDDLMMLEDPYYRDNVHLRRAYAYQEGVEDLNGHVGIALANRDIAKIQEAALKLFGDEIKEMKWSISDSGGFLKM